MCWGRVRGVPVLRVGRACAARGVRAFGLLKWATIVVYTQQRRASRASPLVRRLMELGRSSLFDPQASCVSLSAKLQL